MLPLDAVTIEQNTFLNLEIVAATNRSSASSIVTLEIIKDDSVTPVFEQAVYSGSYDPIEGLTLQEIVITQGYDETVRVSLEGGKKLLFIYYFDCVYCYFILARSQLTFTKMFQSIPTTSK